MDDKKESWMMVYLLLPLIPFGFSLFFYSTGITDFDCE